MDFLRGLAAFFVLTITTMHAEEDFPGADLLPHAEELSLKPPADVTDFSELVQSFHAFADKTEFIREVMTQASYINDISWPRGCGKTITLSMLHYFLDTRKSDDFDTFAGFKISKDRKYVDIFDGLKILRDQKFCAKYKKQWPVVFLSFKKMENATSFDAAKIAFFGVIQAAFQEHNYLIEERLLADPFRQEFLDIKNKSAPEAEMLTGISKLCHFVHMANAFKKKVVLLIDDFDAPFRAADVHNYFDEMKRFMEKTNPASWLQHSPFVAKAVVMSNYGITPSSMLKHMELVDDYTILNGKFNYAFGFTPEDIGNLLQQTRVGIQNQELTKWYGGYGAFHNPRSVINCLEHKGTTGPYWVRSSGSELVSKAIGSAGVAEIVTINCYLLKNCKHSNGSIERELEWTVTSPIQRSSGGYSHFLRRSFWGVLVHAGYLNAKYVSQSYKGNRFLVSIPNKEVRDEITSWFKNKFNKEAMVRFKKYDSFVKCLKKGEVAKTKNFIWGCLKEKGSYYDFKGAVTWGIAKEYGEYLCEVFAPLRHDYDLECHEVGDFDRTKVHFILVPRDRSLTGVIFQLEVPIDESELKSLEEVKGRAGVALQRIKDSFSNMTTEFVAAGCKRVVGVGVGVSLKGIEFDLEEFSVG